MKTTIGDLVTSPGQVRTDRLLRRDGRSVSSTVTLRCEEVRLPRPLMSDSALSRSTDQLSENKDIMLLTIAGSGLDKAR